MAKENDFNLSDRLPADWKRRVSAYRGPSAKHYQRVLRVLSEYEWMTQDERERAAFVIVERELLLEQGQTVEDDE
jgi:hypothetical protein